MTPATRPCVFAANKWIPYEQIEVIKAEEDYAGYYFIVTFKWKSKIYKSRLVNRTLIELK